MKQTTKSAGKGTGRTLKLEVYKPKSKLKAGKYVTVFEKDGDVKLLPATALLPAGLTVSGIEVIARKIEETFDPQYGFGSSPIAGRFALQRYTGTDITFFGWMLAAPHDFDADQALTFNVFMGKWPDPEPSPVHTFAILAVHISYALLGGGGLGVLPTLSISVNGAETIHQFLGNGTGTVFFLVHKPDNINHVPVIVTYRKDLNGRNTSIIVNKVERYTSFIYPIEDLEILSV